MSGRKMSMSFSSIHSKDEKPVSVMWGCELGKGNESCVFSTEDDNLEHLLGLWTICLGAGAKDEVNVVAVELEYRQGKPFTIASLRPSILPMVNVYGLEFNPPVTFILTSGSGPVHMSGQHLTLEEDLEDESEGEMLSQSI